MKASRTAGKDYSLTLNNYSEARIELVKLVLRYEAGLMGGTTGQALRRLVMRRASRGDVPEELPRRLAEIDAERERAAVAVELDAIA